MGTLYVVATPIGNLEDITLRALRILREVPLIAAEDTRHTRKLLAHFEIPTRTVSYHEHNALARRDILLAALDEGDMALVSDAGTPAISDPGQDIVRAALAAGHTVTPIPGPAAVITALVASGLSTDRFTYLGFLPRRSSERTALLRRFARAPETLVLYEAPHRLRECLADLREALGDREAVLARELTKLHEDYRRGTLDALRASYAAGNDAPRGEYTLVVSGASPDTMSEADGTNDNAQQHDDPEARIRAALAGGASVKDAAASTAKAGGISRREAYRLALDVAAEKDEGE